MTLTDRQNDRQIDRQTFEFLGLLSEPITFLKRRVIDALSALKDIKICLFSSKFDDYPTWD